MIRWEVGRSIFDCLGNKVKTFLKYTDEGSSFVYGDDLVRVVPTFAFEVSAFVGFLLFGSKEWKGGKFFFKLKFNYLPRRVFWDPEGNLKLC